MIFYGRRYFNRAWIYFIKEICRNPEALYLLSCPLFIQMLLKLYKQLANIGNISQYFFGIF